MCHSLLKKALLFLLASGAFALNLQAQQPAAAQTGAEWKSQQTSSKQFKVPEGWEYTPDVQYGTGGGKPLRLNWLRPKKRSGPLPAIVFIHGGGWGAGNRLDWLPGLPSYYWEADYFYASIDYRYMQEAIFPACLEDCKCAIRYLRAHAQELGIDPKHIGVFGGSAGGHLVAMMGTTGGVKEFEGNGGWQDQDSRVQAVVDRNGPADLVSILTAKEPSKLNWPAPKSLGSVLIGAPIQQNPDKARKASPVTYISAQTPPFLILHGDKDECVPFSQSEEFYAALKKAGVDATFHPFPGEGHGIRDKSQFKLALDFFDRVLKGKKPAQ